MTITMPQRAERSLRLLLGMRLPRVTAALYPYGFSHAVVLEGWSLMGALTPPNEPGASGEQAVVPPGLVPEQTMEQLEAFAAAWFPVVNAVLTRHFPEQARLLFHRIGVAEGLLSPVVATIFVDRLRTMAQAGAPFFEDGPAAWNQICQHGLSEEVLQNISAMAERALITPRAPERSPEREQEASDALWNWYLQWSRIVRSAVKNKALLRSMGFESASRGSKATSRPRRTSRAKTTQVRLISENRTADEKASQRLGPGSEAKNKGGDKR